ncbi:MAG TPA: hypothetical protein VH475_04525 [Tepidisphaeraceae bacterium]|jgi:hypothetical protein
MKRLARILLNVVTMVSLVLCAATGLAWVRSYAYLVGMSGTVGNVRYEIFSQRGQVVLVRFQPWAEASAATCFWDPVGPIDNSPAARAWGPVGIGWDAQTYHRWIGFEYASGIYTPPFSWQLPRAPFRRIGMPLWSLITVFALAPSRGFWRLARRCRPSNSGACTICGYDLRATPHRCPECGHVQEGARA